MSDEPKYMEAVTPEPATGKINEPATEQDELGEKDLENVSGGRIQTRL